MKRAAVDTAEKQENRWKAHLWDALVKLAERLTTSEQITLQGPVSLLTILNLIYLFESDDPDDQMQGRMLFVKWMRAQAFQHAKWAKAMLDFFANDPVIDPIESTATAWAKLTDEQDRIQDNDPFYAQPEVRVKVSLEHFVRTALDEQCCQQGKYETDEQECPECYIPGKISLDTILPCVSCSDHVLGCTHCAKRFPERICHYSHCIRGQCVGCHQTSPFPSCNTCKKITCTRHNSHGRCFDCIGKKE